ncbi:MAG: DNA mismatch endonuclease Vsr [Bacteroidetes bacterium]|nr:DNA mismatch endonuclease Vsr [Bacteroidota bacterium]
MADMHSKEIRSYNMSRIRSKDTKPEMLVRKFLHKSGFRYRLHVKELPGKPDIVLPKYKTIILVHGCFWHGHDGCQYFKMPTTRTEYWLNKIIKNKTNDSAAVLKLKKNGWNVIIIWECELKREALKQTLGGVLKALISRVQ